MACGPRSALWALAGVGFAGAYMPGLKALTDRLPPRESSRSITSYTGSFSIGVGLSFLVVAARRGALRLARGVLRHALGPLVDDRRMRRDGAVPARVAAQGHLLDFRPVLRNRAAMGYVLGYGAHCFELYGMRTWIVAFWSYVAARNGDWHCSRRSPSAFSLRWFACRRAFSATKPAIRFGRHRAITIVMIVSGAVALSIGGFVTASPALLLALVLIYAITIPARLRARSPPAWRVAPFRRTAAPPWRCIRRSGSGSPRSAAGPAASRSMRSAAPQARPDGRRCLPCSRPACCSARWRCGGRGTHRARGRGNREHSRFQENRPRSEPDLVVPLANARRSLELAAQVPQHDRLCKRTVDLRKQ